MKIIHTGKRAAPPKADMFMPRAMLVCLILIFLCDALVLVLGILTENWAEVLLSCVYLPLGILWFLWWKNQSIKILDEDTFRYTNMFGKKSIHSFSRISHIQVYLSSISVLVGRKRIFIDGGARVTKPLAQRLNEVLEQQGSRYRVGKVGKGRMAILVICAVIIGVLSGLASSGILDAADDTPPGDKTFSADGMSITLTDEFLNTTWAAGDAGGYNTVYSDGAVTVITLKEDFTLVAGFEEYTLEEYAQLTIEANAMDTAVKRDENGLLYFDHLFADPESGDTYYYYDYVFKSGDAFWLVQFAVLEEEAASYAADVARWAKSIEFEAGLYVEGAHSGVEGDVI